MSNAARTIVTANITLPTPMAARRKYISPKVDTVDSRATQAASISTPAISRRVAPKRLMAAPPSRISGALSQNAVTRPPVAAWLQ